MVARLSFVAEGVENEAVRTQPLLSDAVEAFKVLVTLPSVFKRSVGFGTTELACTIFFSAFFFLFSNHENVKDYG